MNQNISDGGSDSDSSGSIKIIGSGFFMIIALFSLKFKTYQ